ncbi:hypothetical protein RhiirA1_454160 [Rhizophagus irregularis]|uniref:Uncharacterized protein n=1 Tax=Rhizophagus irregularis TaxID=588596 RepID=A0A2I1EFN6_9GLOM|nr:hypothetical protein RhiirA1_454160 [Rhizophagus irregularis]PKY20942.1 hypothetical protein RhiirB3_434397 [Rhizophagus irregularis]
MEKSIIVVLAYFSSFAILTGFAVLAFWTLYKRFHLSALGQTELIYVNYYLI